MLKAFEKQQQQQQKKNCWTHSLTTFDLTIILLKIMYIFSMQIRQSRFFFLSLSWTFYYFNELYCDLFQILLSHLLTDRKNAYLQLIISRKHAYIILTP